MASATPPTDPLAPSTLLPSEPVFEDGGYPSLQSGPKDGDDEVDGMSGFGAQGGTPNGSHSPQKAPNSGRCNPDGPTAEDAATAKSSITAAPIKNVTVVAPSDHLDASSEILGSEYVTPLVPSSNQKSLLRRSSLHSQDIIPDHIHRCPDCGAPCESCLRLHDHKRIHPDGDAMQVEGMDAYGVLYTTSPRPSQHESRRLRRDSILSRTGVTAMSSPPAAPPGNGAAPSSPGGAEIAQFEVEEDDDEEAEDGCCEVSFTIYDGVAVQFWGKEFSFDVVLYLLGTLFIGVAWLALWTALPPHLTEPAGAILGPMSTIIVCTFVGQYIVGRNLGLPPIVGIFFSSIIWNHIYEVGFLSRGTFTVLRFVISRIGLTTILVRAGMALSWKSIRPTVFYTTALATIPLVVETVLSAGLAYTLFHEQYNHNWKWAFLHGFMCSVIAAGIVAPELLALVAKGYNKGPVALALSSVGFDTALGVWAIGFMNQLIFSDLQVGLLAALGPVQLIGGVALGFFVAFLFCLVMRLMRRNMWRNPTAMRRFTLAYFLCIAFAAVFFGEKYDLSGGGTMLALTFATGVGHMLEFEAQIDEKNLVAKAAAAGACGADTRKLSISGIGVNPSLAGIPKTARQAAIERGRHCAAMQRADLVLDLRDFWDNFVAGPLFSMSGTLVNVTKLFSADFFPKGILIFAVGSIVRLLASGLTVTFGLGYDPKEIVFLALTWFGKGAVQAATGGIALQNANDRQSSLPANATVAEIENAARDVAAGETILNTAVLYIVFAAPLCAIFITKLGPKLLPPPE